MPFANNQGVRLYYEVTGQGAPILLSHGATGDISFWRDYGYVDRLKDHYTVVLFDARGHGRSDKPYDPQAYAYPLLAADVTTILDRLGFARAHYWGYSMGGYVGLGIAKLQPERLLSLVIGGTDPFQLPVKESEPSPMLAIFQRGVTGGVDEIVASIRELAGSITPQYEQRLRSLDPQAIVAYLERARLRPSFGDALAQMKMPCLLYAGEADKGAFKNGHRAAEQMPNAQFFSLPELNHVGAGTAVDLIMPEVLAFLSGAGAVR